MPEPYKSRAEAAIKRFEDAMIKGKPLPPPLQGPPSRGVLIDQGWPRGAHTTPEVVNDGEVSSTGGCLKGGEATYFSPDEMDKSPEELAGTLTHEGERLGQEYKKTGPDGKPANAAEQKQKDQNEADVYMLHFFVSYYLSLDASVAEVIRVRLRLRAEMCNEQQMEAQKRARQ